MPEHTSWFTYLLSMPAMRNLEHKLDVWFWAPPGVERSPLTLEFSALALMALLIATLCVLVLRMRIARTESAVVPEGKLTVSSFMENFIEVFYGTLKDALGAEDAKYFLPIIGTCAVFIFFGNALGLIPGFEPATSNFNVTFACGTVIFLSTHIYGVRRNGLAYFKHFVGPVWWLAPLMIPLELISHIARPITLGVRLMVNMFVDHLVVSVFTALVALILPVPIMLLGILVVVVQTYVFCLLATVYIKMAVEHHDEEGHEGAHGHDPHHGHAHAGTGALAGVQEAPLAG